MKHLDEVVKGRNYANFDMTAMITEKVIVEYYDKAHVWIFGAVGSGKKITVILKMAKSAGTFCAGIAAVIIAAPSSLLAAVLSSITIGRTYDSADAFGRSLAGVKQMPQDERKRRIVANGIGGAAGALLAGVVLKNIGESIVKNLMSTPFTKNWAREAVKNTLTSKYFQREMKLLATQVVKETGEGTVKEISRQLAKQVISDDVVENILQKFIISCHIPSGYTVFS